MRYAEYRQAGLPITSCHMESTIKRINRRIKGTEKFWSCDGGEAILQLVADHLMPQKTSHDFHQPVETRLDVDLFLVAGITVLGQWASVSFEVGRREIEENGIACGMPGRLVIQRGQVADGPFLGFAIFALRLA